MKTSTIQSLAVILYVVFTFLPGLKHVSAQNPSRSVILSLSEAEVPVVTESCFLLKDGADEIYLVTEKGGQIFVYDNGRKSGPFENFAAAGIKECSVSSEDDCAAYNNSGANAFSPDKHITYEPGQMTVKVGGKTYGPFHYVIDMFVNKDEKKFIAVVMDEAMSPSFLNAEGTVFPLEGNVVQVHLSPSGTKGLVSIKVEDNAAALEVMNTDWGSMTQEQMLELAQKLQEAQAAQDANPPQGYIYMINGEKYGPYDPSIFSTNNPGYCKTGGDNWFLIDGSDLYVNGRLLMNLGDEYPRPCDVWLSKDGLRAAVATFDKLYFSDGKTYPFPLRISLTDNGGTTYLSWISFEEEKHIVRYSRPL